MPPRPQKKPRHEIVVLREILSLLTLEELEELVMRRCSGEITGLDDSVLQDIKNQVTSKKGTVCRPAILSAVSVPAITATPEHLTRVTSRT
jgi:hypothetical protein